MGKSRTEVLPSFWKYSTHPNAATCEAADAVCTFMPPPRAGTALSWALPPGGWGRPQRWWLADKASTQSPPLLCNATQTLFGSLFDPYGDFPQALLPCENLLKQQNPQGGREP